MLLLMALLTRGNTALGDAKLAACLGLILGVSPVLYAMWATFASLTVYGRIKRIPKTSFVPLAPFFFFGLFAGLLVLTY
jgi:prepilin signal peptidase PulO-like enzyme (type II secretory pathway)